MEEQQIRIMEMQQQLNQLTIEQVTAVQQQQAHLANSVRALSPPPRPMVAPARIGYATQAPQSNVSTSIASTMPHAPIATQQYAQPIEREPPSTTREIQQGKSDCLQYIPDV